MRKMLVIILIISIFMTACNLPNQENASLSPIPDINEMVTQAFATLSVTKTTTSTPTPAIPSTPSVLATNEPKIYFDGDTNCRTGPGVKFTLVTKIKEGESAELLGESANKQYWIVKDPQGSGPCWIVRDFSTPQGNIEKLAVATAPATLTPMPIPDTPIMADWSFSCEYASPNDQSLSTITVELKWRDTSDYELGYDIYRNDEMIVSLPANSTSYTDVAYLAFGQGLTYIIEAWNNDGAVRSKEIKAQCK